MFYTEITMQFATSKPRTSEGSYEPKLWKVDQKLQNEAAILWIHYALT